MTTIEFNKRITSIEDSLLSYGMYLSKNTEDARDLLQETYLRALINKNKFDPHTNLKTWTHVIMKNIFINNYRKQKRHRDYEDVMNNGLQSSSFTSRGNYSPEEIFEEKELKQKLSDFDSRQDRVLTMNMEGYKYREIAEKTNLPIGTVKSRISLSRKKFLNRYKEYDNQISRN